MLKTLYEPLPDEGLYLERIHMDLPVARTKETLDRLIYLHQCEIPFENLDVYYGKREISSGVEEVFDKIIRRKRGGFCFEMNNLFHAFLKKLDFDVYPCLCKVLEGEEPIYPALHRGTIARFDGELYYCDIGFGGPVPAGAIRLEDGAVQRFAEDSYVMRRRRDGWWELIRLGESGEENPMLRINPLPYAPEDFVALCHYACCHTQRTFNHFTDELLLNIRLAEGYASITDRVMKIKRKGRVEERRFEHREELLRAMRKIFHLPEEIEGLVGELPG